MKDSRLYIRIDRETKERWILEAEKLGMSLSEYVIWAVSEAPRVIPVEGYKPVLANEQAAYWTSQLSNVRDALE